MEEILCGWICTQCCEENNWTEKRTIPYGKIQQCENCGQEVRGTSTTPAENTDVNRLSACVDWVSVSFRCAKNATEVFNAILGIEALDQMEFIYGARYEYAGYDCTYRLGKIDLMANHEKGQYLLNMSGQGCREFEMLSKYDIRTLFFMISHFTPTYTRLDIAIDDFKGIYHVSTIRKSVYKGCCVTYLKSFGDSKRGSIANAKDISMDNFYLGNGKSRYFINIYDKKLERLSKAEALPLKEDGQPVDVWTRTEVRFKYEYAQQFVAHILNVDDKPLGYHIIGFLKAKLTFLKPSCLHLDSNKSRLAEDEKNHARWWRIYTREVEELPLTVVVPENTLSDNIEWLLHQVSTSLAMLNVYDPDSFSHFLHMLTATGDARLQKRHLRKVVNQRILDGEKPNEAIKVYSHTNTITPAKIEEYKQRQNEIIKSRTLKNVLDIHWNKIKEQLEDENKKEYTEAETELINFHQDMKEVRGNLEFEQKYKKKSRTAN